MYLKQLSIHYLRNFQETHLALSQGFNLFIGKNGSGKTSLLEAVYLLATGQSFRTYHALDFIQTGQPRCCVTGQILPVDIAKCAEGTASAVRIGVQRDRLGGREIHVNEEICRTRGELARLLPVQIMNTESYQLFNLPPKHRRAFLDWGVFHVEPAFISLWARYQRALKQRNAAIKQAKGAGSPLPLVSAWDAELIETGESIHALRLQFVSDFTPAFQFYLAEFLKISPSFLSYHQGWPETVDLKGALVENRGRDLALGYTTMGPHRADFGANLSDKPVEKLLSRGQLKLFVAALMLARHAWLFERKGYQSMFLLDDLSSELDEEARFRLLQGLQQMGGQVWITAMEDDKAFEGLVRENGARLFHVEQGSIRY